MSVSPLFEMTSDDTIGFTGPSGPRVPVTLVEVPGAPPPPSVPGAPPPLSALLPPSVLGAPLSDDPVVPPPPASVPPVFPEEAPPSAPVPVLPPPEGVPVLPLPPPPELVPSVDEAPPLHAVAVSTTATHKIRLITSYLVFRRCVVGVALHDARLPKSERAWLRSPTF